MKHSPGSVDPKRILAHAFVMPWSATSVIFVVLSSLLLAGVESRGILLPISLTATFFLASWFFNYAFEVLDHAANGGFTAPVATIEVLSPFHWRPLLIVTICFLATAAGEKLGVTGGLICLLLWLTLPASIAALGVGDNALQAANPLILWRIVVGLGAYYALALAVIGLFVLLMMIPQAANLRPFVRYLLLEIGVLTAFAVLGAAVYLRRIEIGFEPRSSPERRVERDAREHQRQLDEILDEAYVQARLKDYERASTIIKRWLSDASGAGFPGDLEVILLRVRGWGDPAAFACIERAIGAQAEHRGDPPWGR